MLGLNDPTSKPEREGYLTDQDHDDIATAISLVAGVISRHAIEATLPTIATLDAAICEMRIGERRMKEGW